MSEEANDPREDAIRNEATLLQEADENTTAARIGQLLNITSADVLFPVAVAIILRDRSEFAMADVLFSKCAEIEQCRAAALAQLAISKALQNDPASSVEAWAMMEAIEPLDAWSMAFAAVQYARVGRRERAEHLLVAAVKEDGTLRNRCFADLQFFRFLSIYSHAIANDLLQQLQRQFRQITVSEIEIEIKAALDHQQPYFLLRMGDGEGSCIRFDLKDDENYVILYRENQKEFLDIWFRNKLIIEDEQFDAAVDEFNASIYGANCVGFIDQERIDHEYRIGKSPRNNLGCEYHAKDA